MNDKRPKTQIEDDLISSNPEGAIKGIAIFLIAMGFILFIIKYNNAPDPLVKVQTKENTKTILTQNTIQEEKNNALKDYWALNATIGGFASGIAGTLFSLSGFALLYLTFKRQTEANVTQLRAYNHDKVESRFFELIKLHRDNVNELKFTTRHIEYKNENGKFSQVLKTTDYENRHFFVAFKNQFKDAFSELAHIFNFSGEQNIYTLDYIQKLQNNTTLIERKIDLVEYAKIDLTYLIVFFGLSIEGKATIKSLVRYKYQHEFVNKVLKVASLKPKAESTYFRTWNMNRLADNYVSLEDEIIKGHFGEHENVEEIYGMHNYDGKMVPIKGYYPDNYEKFYGGHQFRLGHYFRHIFHTISFINDNPDLSPKEQYSYVKHLRGQLSTNEQVIIFLNSISQLGRTWELEDKKSGGAVERWKQLISDYMIIKNIPHDHVIPLIQLSEFYPDIVYEGFDISKNVV